MSVLASLDIFLSIDTLGIYMYVFQRDRQFLSYGHLLVQAAHKVERFYCALIYSKPVVCQLASLLSVCLLIKHCQQYRERMGTAAIP